MKHPTRKQMVEAARRFYEKDGEIEIDENAEVSRSRGIYPGAYVQAWVWVHDRDARKMPKGKKI